MDGCPQPCSLQPLLASARSSHCLSLCMCVCVCVCVCVCACVLVIQSCPTLCKPMDCNLPGSSIYGILQARILEWFAIPFSRGSSRPRDQTWVSCTAGGLLSHQGSPYLPLAALNSPDTFAFSSFLIQFLNQRPTTIYQLNENLYTLPNRYSL